MFRLLGLLMGPTADLTTYSREKYLTRFQNRIQVPLLYNCDQATILTELRRMLEVFSLKWYISFVSYRRITTLSAQM